MCKDIHRNVICNIPKLATSQMSMNPYIGQKKTQIPEHAYKQKTAIKLINNTQPNKPHGMVINTTYGSFFYKIQT